MPADLLGQSWSMPDFSPFPVILIQAAVAGLARDLSAIARL
ncbi:hypothetical protein [Mesorhizobium sp. M0488]